MQVFPKRDKKLKEKILFRFSLLEILSYNLDVKANDFFKKVTNSKFDIIKEIINILKKNKIDYCVIGGVAINAYCEPLLTLDFDIVVEKDKLKELRRILKEKGFKIKSHPFTYEIKHPESDIRIQIQRDDRYQEFIRRAKLREILGYKLKVANKEDLLISKLWAFMDESRDELKKEKDFLDIKRLLKKYPRLEKILKYTFPSLYKKIKKEGNT